MNLGFDSS